MVLGLFGGDSMELEWQKIKEFLSTAGIDLLKGIGIFIVGAFAIHWIVKLVEKSKKFQGVEPSLRTFLKNLVRLVLYVLLILTVCSVIGIPLTSILTLVASLGVAVSLALQGVFGNLLGGIMLMFLKPIKAGEYIKVGDHEGTVQVIGAYYTEINTPDNRHISLPNSSLTNTAIVNFTREGLRRAEWIFSVSYKSDLDQVYATLNGLFAENSLILADPAPSVVLSKCADSALEFTVRAWVKATDYLNVYFDILDKGKRALDAAGIEIPYPQMDVHMKE